MKYLITESQIDNAVFKYLDNQNFIQIEKNDLIYLANSEEDTYSQIKYRKKDGWCFVYYKLINNVSLFFSLGIYTSEEIIGRWVENTLQMKVIHSRRAGNALSRIR
jgi:hypothetical protein